MCVDALCGPFNKFGEQNRATTEADEGEGGAKVEDVAEDEGRMK